MVTIKELSEKYSKEQVINILVNQLGINQDKAALMYTVSSGETVGDVIIEKKQVTNARR